MTDMGRESQESSRTTLDWRDFTVLYPSINLRGFSVLLHRLCMYSPT